MSSAPNPVAHLHNNTADWWFKDPGLRSLCLAIAVGFSSSVSIGYDGALMNGLMANPLFMKAIDNPGPTKLGTIVAAQSLGALPFYLPGSMICDKIGRRGTLAIGYIITIAGALVQTFTYGGWKMFAGRFILGMGGAFCSVSGGPYTTEISHPRNRAQTTALIQTCFYIGSIIAAWVTFGAVYLKGTDWSWRMCCLFQTVVPILALIAILMVPESPRWLVAQGRVDAAHQVLARYHANGDLSDELVLFELEEIKEAIEMEAEAAKSTPWSSFVRTKGNRRRLFILAFVGFGSQWAGNGVISYYLVNILNSVGITNPSQQTGYNGGLQVFNWLMSIGGSLVSEKFGRRKMWLASSIGMFFSYVVITACSAAYSNGQAGAGKAVLAFLFIYFGFYDIGYTPLTLSYPLEILPYNMRAKGVGILMTCLMLAGTFNNYVNPIALDAIAWKYYFVFLAVLLLSILVIWFVFPETKGRMLEEIAVLFDGEAAALPAQNHLREEQDLKERAAHVEDVAHQTVNYENEKAA